jgi:hypothetical protein
MAITAEIAGRRSGRRWWVAPAGTVAALAVIGAPLYAIHAADDRDDVILTRNEVMREALGGRTWFGALANATDSPRTEVAVRIRFHDRDGRPVGSPLSARAARLGPNEAMHLQARLPAEAVGLRIHALRWTAGGRVVEFGPGEPLPFGSFPG